MAARKWITIDAETDPFEFQRVPEPFVWGAFDGEHFRSWWNDTSGFVDWLSDFSGIAYAHNGGRFDFHFLAPWFNASRPIRIIGSRIASVFVGNCELRDSWLLAPMALSGYQKDSIDYALIERETREAHKREIREYLRGDCVYLRELLDRFFQRVGVHLTLPGAGLKMLESRYGKTPRNTERLDARLRPWYFGGRTQAFRIGTADLRFEVWDINSAYPSVMREKLPWGTQVQKRKKIPRSESALMRSFLKISAVSSGALPIREGKRVEYPDDDIPRVYHCCGPELVAATELGLLRVEKVLECYTFADSISFGDWVEELWAEKARCRDAGDRAGEYVAKILLNGTYGKFAQDPRKFLDYAFCNPIRDGEWPPGKVLRVGPHYLSTVPAKFGRFLSVHTAASITSRVRALLLRALAQCDVRLYCDTDSIAGVSVRVPKGSALGEWKLEAECDYYAIGGRKLYAFRTLEGQYKTASKGVQLSPNEIIQVANGETVTHRKDAPAFRLGNDPMWITRNIRRNKG